MSAAGGLEAWLEETRVWTERLLERELARLEAPPRLLEAMRHPLLGSGKRLRPALLRRVCQHFGGSDEAAELPAVAVEFVHTYSLVHDDLPCMDDDDLRRGRPTCHKVFGEALAVLAGDALLTDAFALLARVPRGAAHVAALARAAGAEGMVGGQALDLAPGSELVEEIHRRKTAALLGAAAEMGALGAAAPDEALLRARMFGIALGGTFQATDDILDVTGTSASLGKTPGKDQRAAKPTLVAALGLEGARVRARELAATARAAAYALGERPGGPLHELVDLVLDRER